MIISWIRENKEWVFSGFGLLILSGLISIIVFIIRKIRNRKAKLSITVSDKQSKFYRTVISSENYQDRDTVIVPVVLFHNNTSEDIVIVRYKVKIISPPQYRYTDKNAEPLFGDKIFRFRLAENNSSWFSGPENNRIDIEKYTTTKPLNLCLRIPIVISREVKELQCKIKIWGQKNQTASCKFKLVKGGY